MFFLAYRVRTMDDRKTMPAQEVVKMPEKGLTGRDGTASKLEMDELNKSLVGSRKTLHSAPCSPELGAVMLTAASTVSNFDYLNICMSLMNYFVFASKCSFPYCKPESTLEDQ